MIETGPKWDISATLYSGQQGIELTEKYPGNLAARFKPDAFDQFKVDLAQLREYHTGQVETLNVQKTQTKGKDETAQLEHKKISKIRNMIKASTNDPQILQGFGIGTEIKSNSENSVIAAANLIINGFETFSDWAKTEAGILDTDIEELRELNTRLAGADELQGKAIAGRKANTVDRDALQRAVEDHITKLSAAGDLEYCISNPAVAKLFRDLIPSRGNGVTDDNEGGTDTNGGSGDDTSGAGGSGE